MDVKVVFDWKSQVVLSGLILGIILVNKMDTASAEAVFTHVVDTVKGLTVANCNR